MMPIVAIVGRPNVGKSTLFNRLAGFRKAIVEDLPGVTRDRNYVDVDRYETSFTLIDTGGFEPVAKEGLLAQMAEQCRLAVEEADIIIFLLDGKEGLTSSDREIGRLLRRRNKRVLHVVNKIDGPKHEEKIYEFYGLGVDTLYPISAQHNLGIDGIIEALMKLTPTTSLGKEADEQGLKIALAGRPNVGKSSIINRLLGYERIMVHETPGTTRDSIDTPFSLGETRYVLVDTAGLRRKSRISLRLEKYCVVEAIRSIERADIVLLVLDAQEPGTEQDARIGSLVHDKGKGLVLLVNKWDLVEKTATLATFSEHIRNQLQFLEYAPIVLASARSGWGLSQIFEVVNEIAAEGAKRIPTPQLNRWLQAVTEFHSPPMFRGRSVRLSYITQGSSRPPTFIIFTNYPAGIPYAYRRYLVNQLRKHFGFHGNPIRLVLRKKH